MKEQNIYMCGVGGQGIGVLSEVMVQACLASGHRVKSVDTHGLAQRGGVVVSHLRLGDRVQTPRIDPGQAHVVISLERLEAYRAAVNMLAQGGAVVYYDTEYQPIHVRMGKASYPSVEEVASAVARREGQVHRVKVESLPDPRMQNTALLGRLSGLGLVAGVEGAMIEAALRNVLKPAMVDENLKVFNTAKAPVEA